MMQSDDRALLLRAADVLDGREHVNSLRRETIAFELRTLAAALDPASLGRGLDPEGETGKRASVDGLREMVDLLLQQRGKPILAFVRERDRDAAYQVGLMLDELARALDINSPSLPHVPIKPWFPEGDPEGERRPPQQGEKQCR